MQRVLNVGSVLNLAVKDTDMVKDDTFESSESFCVMIMPVSVPYSVQLGTPRSSAVVIIDDDSKLIAVSL